MNGSDERSDVFDDHAEPMLVGVDWEYDQLFLSNVNPPRPALYIFIVLPRSDSNQLYQGAIVFIHDDLVFDVVPDQHFHKKC